MDINGTPRVAGKGSVQYGDGPTFSVAFGRRYSRWLCCWIGHRYGGHYVYDLTGRAFLECKRCGWTKPSKFNESP
jgi:hypothetical protein